MSVNFQVTSSKSKTVIKVRNESSFTCGTSKAEAIDVPCGEDCAGTEETEAIDVTCGRGEVSETYLAPNPNEGTAAFGSRVKSDKDGIIVIRR